MQIKHPISFAIYAFLAYFLIRVAFLSLPWRDGRVITYDPAGYYLPLPAKFIYDDLHQFAFYDSISTKYNIGDAVSHVFDLPNGRRALKYSLGMAVLYTPGFLAGHIAAKLGEYPQDGYSKPYLKYMCLWALMVALAGLFVLRYMLLVYFDDITTAFTLGLLVFATNYLPYAAINNLMAHSFLFTLYALLIYFSYKWHKHSTWQSSAGIGITIGLLTIARPTELIAVMVPILFGIDKIQAIPNHLRNLIKQWPKLLFAAALIVGIGFIQLLYWKKYTGNWLLYSYQEQGFDFLNPHIWDGLFSFRKGWLIYTPLMIFSILGFVFLWKRKIGLFLPFFAFFLVNTYIVFSWAIWWYGGSLGARAVIQSYALLAFPLAAIVCYALERRNLYLKLGLAILVLLLIDSNLTMTWQATAPSGPWNAEYMTQKYYAKIFGKTVVNKNNRKFLDTKYEMSDKMAKNAEILVAHDFESDKDSLKWGNTNEFAASSAHSMRINNALPAISYTIPIDQLNLSQKAWVRFNAKIMYHTMEWNEWRMARMKMKFIRNGKVIGAPSIRLQWLSDPWVWNNVNFDYPLKKAFGNIQKGDQIQFIIQNNESERSIYVDDLIIYARR